jgi:hypothetical protein
MVAFAGLICDAKMCNLSWMLGRNPFHHYVSSQVCMIVIIFVLFLFWVLTSYIPFIVNSLKTRRIGDVFSVPFSLQSSL